MRVDKVTRIMNFLGFKKVYSLVLNEEGLYMIMTGNVGGLPKAFAHLGGGDAGQALGAVAATPIIKKFQDELANGEARLGSEDLKALANEKKNEFLTRDEIQAVEVSYGKTAKMELNTTKGKFKFEFTCTPEEELKALEAMLKG